MRLLYTSIFFFFFGLTLLKGQGEQAYTDYHIKGKQPSRKQLLRIADKAYEKKDFTKAFAYYESVAVRDSSDTKALYMAAILADSFEAVIEAVRYYEIAALNQDRTQFPLLDFQLGNNYLTMGEYDKAIQSFERFRNDAITGSISTEKKYVDLSQQLIEDCKQAKRAILQPNKNFTNLKRLDYQVNTDLSSEFAPYELDGMLYFSRLYYGRLSDTTDLQKAKFNVYVANGNGEGLNPAVGSGDQNAHTAFSKDGKYMYDTDCQYIPAIKQHRCRIYRREKDASGNWINRQPISGKINLNGYNTTHPAIGTEPNGIEVLYFASDRPNGKGGMDIWKSVIIPAQDSSLAYSEPINVERINTSFNEITPFYHNRCEVLYFSSDKRGTLGGYDIYQAIWNGSNLEEPQSLGYPLNSSFDDVYFFRNADGTKSYFASKRIDEEVLKYDREYKGCCLDIYSAEVEIDVKVNIAAYCGDERLNDIYYTATGFGERGTNLVLASTPIDLEINEDYVFTVSKTGYTTDKFNILTQNLCEATTYNQRAYIRPLQNLTVNVRGLGLQNREEKIDSVNIKLIDAALQIPVASYENIAGENIRLSVEPEKTYKIVVSSNTYIDTSMVFTTPPSKKFCDTLYNIVLVPNLPELPLLEPLYFHNAIPRIADNSISYKITYDQYLDLLPQYKAGLKNYYLSIQDTISANGASNKVDDFFENQVKTGYNKLNLYAEAILIYLQRGRTVTLRIRGTASPRASDTYNKALSERRINSVREYLKTWKNGALAAYINEDKLQINPLPIGIIEVDEVTKEKMGTDFGVYDPLSASLRRVIIEEISSGN
ncbi:MAG: hypothetical protein HC892_17640 [Saprospiraceae bacterium]|nr:hypothetical protein [Saprospiraceae bacterium]